MSKDELIKNLEYYVKCSNMSPTYGVCSKYTDCDGCPYDIHVSIDTLMKHSLMYLKGEANDI